MLIILLLGSQLQREIGERGLATLMVQSIVAGAVAFLLTNFSRPESVVLGASAAAVGILVTYCLLNYERPLTFMLFLIVPITVKAKWILWVTVGIDAFLFLTRELPGANVGVSVAHSAHLGGALAGFLFFKFALGGEFSFKKPSFGSATSWKPRGFADAAADKPKRKFSYRPKQQVVNLEKQTDFKNEVDRILDKISNEGIGALTDDERAILEKASNLQKR